MNNTFAKLTALCFSALFPLNLAAEANCDPTPSCADIGFPFTATQCGAIKKLKCPFSDDFFFCSITDCNQVTVNALTQYCSEYCQDTPSMCVRAASRPCTSTGNGLFATQPDHTSPGTLLQSNASPNSIGGNTYLLGPVTTSNVHSATVYSAGEQFNANCAASMNGTPELIMPRGSGSMTGHNTFFVPVTIQGVLNYSGVPGNNDHWESLDFRKGAKLRIAISSVPSYMHSNMILAFGPNTANQVCLMYTGSSTPTSVTPTVTFQGPPVQTITIRYQTNGNINVNCGGLNCERVYNGICDGYSQ